MANTLHSTGRSAWLRQLSLTVAPRMSVDCIQWRRQSRWRRGLLLGSGVFETPAAILVGGSTLLGPNVYTYHVVSGAISIGHGLRVESVIQLTTDTPAEVSCSK